MWYCVYHKEVQENKNLTKGTKTFIQTPEKGFKSLNILLVDIIIFKVLHHLPTINMLVLVFQ